MQRNISQVIQYLVIVLAHEDSIWSCAWKKNDNDGSENVITGGIDDLVKIWRW